MPAQTDKPVPTSLKLLSDGKAQIDASAPSVPCGIGG